MRLVTNPTECDIIDYNVNTKLYTIKAKTSEKMPDDAAKYLCNVYGFLIDEGPCHEPVADAEVKKESAKAVEEKEADPSDDLSMVHGLGTKSVQKLLDAGVKTKKDFNKLSYSKLTEIVGALVASKFKST